MHAHLHWHTRPGDGCLPAQRCRGPGDQGWEKGEAWAAVSKPELPLGCSICWLSPFFQGPCKKPKSHARGCAGCSMQDPSRGCHGAQLTLPTPVASAGRKHPSFTLTHPSRLLQTALLPASPPASATPAAPPTHPATTASVASGSGRACQGGCTAHRSCLQRRGRQSQCQCRQKAQGAQHKLMTLLGHR